MSKLEPSVLAASHPRQIGFANAGDARPSHWKRLADQIFRALEVEGDRRWRDLIGDAPGGGH